MIKKLISVITLLSFISVFCFSSEIDNKLDEQDELIQSLELEMSNIRLMMYLLKEDNEQLNLTVDSCNAKITELMENIESMKKALISNKEDTSKLIAEMEVIYNELENYKSELAMLKRKNNNANLFVQITIPLVTLSFAGYGAYEYFANDSNMGKFMMYGGLGLFVGLEVVWNGGKFIFRIW